jgi:hypothetical protein
MKDARVRAQVLRAKETPNEKETVKTNVKACHIAEFIPDGPDE